MKYILILFISFTGLYSQVPGIPRPAVFEVNYDKLIAKYTVDSEAQKVFEYVEPYFDGENNKFGIRIKKKTFAKIVSQMPNNTLEDTDNLHVEAHSFKLEKIQKNGIVVSFAIRAKQFVFGKKTGEKNCKYQVLLSLAVSSNHEIYYRPPQIFPGEVTESGIGFVIDRLLDITAKVTTFIASGGKKSYGFLTILQAHGAFVLNIVSFFTLWGKLTNSITTDRLTDYLHRIKVIDNKEQNIYLKGIYYDAGGVNILFRYPEEIEDAILQIWSHTFPHMIHDHLQKHIHSQPGVSQLNNYYDFIHDYSNHKIQAEKEFHVPLKHEVRFRGKEILLKEGFWVKEGGIFEGKSTP
ncbi:hypothetical protein [Candidatus Uabimicrobium amorphum]|uniref:Uncharacterized protein n=1 Tax=Uabimicrobium amorphum TaxID=2596890 RepID=A0A5S9IQZ4_UABAM|nr:hypothetical protein [Candidatus Uabimicrobium amorphum]BBM86294.1 hypothetical protein UABAM_04680 [Candidatus Uabimicrobium amorphum]